MKAESLEDLDLTPEPSERKGAWRSLTGAFETLGVTSICRRTWKDHLEESDLSGGADTAWIGPPQDVKQDTPSPVLHVGGSEAHQREAR